MIEVSNLTKYYGGRRALGPVSFEIDRGETVGFLGLNGAGKTTVLRILACDLRPTAGAVKVAGVDALAEPHEVRKRIGFLPEMPPLYPEMQVAEYIEFACDLRGVPVGERKQKIGAALAFTDLLGVAGQAIGTLSHGFRQRVGVAQAIVHRPALVILDEPTRGLDPRQIVEMRKLIHELKDKHTVLLSSHVLSEVSQTCDRLLVLGRGAILGTGTEAELAAGQEATLSIQLLVGIPEAKRSGNAGALVAAALADVALTDRGQPTEHEHTVALTVTAASDVRAAVSRAIVGAGLDLLRLDAATVGLENTFLRMVTPATAAAGGN